jgi:hypothetical protein
MNAVRRNWAGIAGMVLAVGTPAIATTPAHAIDDDVPFRAFYAGQAMFTSDTTVSFEGVGIATQLGLGADHGDATITGPHSSCPGGLANTHVETLDGANGDSLTITAHDVACPVGFLQFRGTGTWEVTGGTGRFTDTTGNGSLNGASNFVTNEFSFVLSGTISAPGT